MAANIIIIIIASSYDLIIMIIYSWMWFTTLHTRAADQGTGVEARQLSLDGQHHHHHHHHHDNHWRCIIIIIDVIIIAIISIICINIIIDVKVIIIIIISITVSSTGLHLKYLLKTAVHIQTALPSHYLLMVWKILDQKQIQIPIWW